MRDFDPAIFIEQLKNGNLSDIEDAILILHHAGIRNDEINHLVGDIAISNKMSMKVRIAAIHFLSETKDSLFCNTIEKCLSDESSRIREQAFYALSEIKSEFVGIGKKTD